ncbi:MAG: hypothetical protein EOP45_21545, partial [Sphingobacteriaceae bacterium]
MFASFLVDELGTLCEFGVDGDEGREFCEGVGGELHGGGGDRGEGGVGIDLGFKKKFNASLS